MLWGFKKVGLPSITVLESTYLSVPAGTWLTITLNKFKSRTRTEIDNLTNILENPNNTGERLD